MGFNKKVPVIRFTVGLQECAIVALEHAMHGVINALRKLRCDNLFAVFGYESQMIGKFVNTMPAVPVVHFMLDNQTVSSKD